MEEIIKLVEEKPRGVLFSDKQDGKKRERKSEDQVAVLVAEYERNPRWSRKKMLQLAQQTGLKVTQVYKWSWDQKKKTQA